MSITKEQITRYGKKLGATLVGYAPVSRWDEYGEVEEDYRPAAIWPEAKTVIVLGVPVSLPIIETTPSINYAELYNTTNNLLDQMSYQLSVYLTEKGHGSIFLPRDGYGDINVLIRKPLSSFSHVFAAKYAGLGTIGYNHLLLNSKYGPRVRYVSIFTDLEVSPDQVIEKDLCINCKICQKLCPSSAFSNNENGLIAIMDKKACACYHSELKHEHRYPCGVCAKVCPIGEDRKIFKSMSSKLYLEEKEALLKDPNDLRYKRWVHIRKHGSSGDRIF